MIVLKVIITAGLLLISACSTVPLEDVGPEMSGDTVNKGEDIASDEEVITAIDADVLYMLLVAELAGQRKQYDIALEGYLRAAKRVDDVRLAERAAKIALYLKDTQKTGDAVALWLERDPDNLDARKIALLSSLREEDKVTSVKHLNFLLQADPAGFETTLLELVKLMQREDKDEFIFEVLDELNAQHPQKAEVPFVQAILAMQMGKTFIAREKVNAALVLQPDWSKALLFQAQLVSASGNLDSARKIIEAAIDKEPENIQLQKLLANVLIKSEKLDQSVEILQKILNQNADDAQSQFTLALVYLQLKKYNRARTLLERLAVSPRYQMQASLYLGRLEVKSGNTDKALIWFDRVSGGQLKFEAAMSAISVLVDAERYDQALDRVQAIRNEYPGQALRFMLLEAEIYNGKKQYRKAFDLLTKGLRKNPQQKELLYTRSLIAERLGRLDILESDLKKILQQYPDDASALNALGYTLAERTDRLLEAEQYLMRAIKLQPDEPVIIDSYGWLLYRQGKPEQAIDYIRRAYQQVKEDEIAAHLVEVLWALGKKDEAMKIFHQSLQNSSDAEQLLELQKRIPELR